ncbi:hypothetical protein [Sphingosinicella sp. YJ22]|uniref:hypothetical protein n=1 Tax=Sphingosinicella sp. YJ22 TaxID=1104780 RepID=UPI00140A0234|nr:hypothetical protein [Sphingosinicella sp. YJ22]
MAKPRSKLPPREAILALADEGGRLAVRAAPGASADAILLPEAGGPLRLVLLRVVVAIFGLH